MKEITPDNQGIGKVTQPRPGQPQSKGTGLTGEFSKVLSEQLNPVKASDRPTESYSSGGLPELGATYAPKMLDLTHTDTQIPDMISGTIDLLDKYAAGLADPGTTLKQAFALLEEISNKTTSIQKDMKEAGNQDASLKDIMAHIDTVVALEKIKINRGDYS